MPASVWYLQAFPVSDLNDVVDFFIYMTYDLHGQWDYGNDSSDDDCVNGNCLRSHVNLTETNYGLSMVTKGGAQSNKLMVDVMSYGRSFEMTTANCTGPTIPTLDQTRVLLPEDALKLLGIFPMWRFMRSFRPTPTFKYSSMMIVTRILSSTTTHSGLNT